MRTPLLELARERRLAALASLPSRSDNVVSLCRLRNERRLTVAPVPFVSTRRFSEPERLAA